MKYSHIEPVKGRKYQSWRSASGDPSLYEPRTCLLLSCTRGEQLVLPAGGGLTQNVGQCQPMRQVSYANAQKIGSHISLLSPKWRSVHRVPIQSRKWVRNNLYTCPENRKSTAEEIIKYYLCTKRKISAIISSANISKLQPWWCIGKIYPMGALKSSQVDKFQK